MTFDFSRVNWFYIGISMAIWLALAIGRWRLGEVSMLDQYLNHSRQYGHYENHLDVTDWTATASSSDGGAVESNRWKAVIGITLAYWAVLLWWMVFPLHVVKWA
jgi:hypothetical protein